MTFSDFYGNEQLKKQLAAALEHRFPQAVLLTGPTGCGKLTLAKILAAGLLCRQSLPCGSCVSCHKVEHNIHPDLTIIDQGTGDLKIETARQIRRDCHILPNDSNRKVYILRHSQNLNVQAQNVLLKTLEEPPEFAFFILTCENEQALLPTVRSRVIRYTLSPLTQPDVMTLLKQAHPELPEETLAPFAARCGGIAGQALTELAAQQAESQALALVRRFLSALASGQEAQMFLAAAPAEKLDRKDFQHFLFLCQSGLRDGIFAACGLTTKCGMFSQQGQALAQSISCDRLLSLYDFISKLSQKIDLNFGLSQACACLTAGAYQICYTNNVTRKEDSIV